MPGVSRQPDAGRLDGRLGLDVAVLCGDLRATSSVLADSSRRPMKHSE